jgi:anti-anti-sigma regulatory factor
MIAIEANVVRVTGQAVIHCASEFHAELAAALPRIARLEGPIVMDVAQLDAMDVVGAQILLAARAQLDARRVRFEGWPGPIAAFLDTCGLAAHFA